MPLLKNAERKQNFLNDIGNMFSQNSNFTQGKKNPDFIKNFTEVKVYFSKDKSDSSQQLAAYVQNFINVYQNHQLSNGESRNQCVDQILANIQSLSDGFKKAYDEYIKENKYTALRNNNVKTLSAMVQTAENMGHRVEMENRMENVEFVAEQIQNEIKASTIQTKEYKEFATYCEQKGIDFVDPEAQLEENKKEYENLGRELEKLKKQQEKLATDSDTSKDVEEVNECSKKLLEHKDKLDKAIKRSDDLLELKKELEYFRAESAEISEELQNYSNSISENRSLIEDANKNIAQEQIKIEEGQEALGKRNDLQAVGGPVYAHDQINQSLETFDEAIVFLNNLNDYNISPVDLASDKPVAANVNIFRFNYQGVKDTLCERVPELRDAFAEMEAGEMSISQFLKVKSDLIIGGKDALRKELSECENAPEYKEFLELNEKVNIGKASENNIKSWKQKKAELENDINMKEELIAATKLKSSLGDRIKKTLGSLPEKPITEKKLVAAMVEARTSSLNELSSLRKSNDPEILKERMQAAQNRIENKNAAALSAKIITIESRRKVIGEKMTILADAVKKHGDIINRTDKMLEIRQTVKTNRLDDAKVDPNEEVYERLNSIKLRFQQKDNKKMNPECKKMMDQLDKTIAAFKPESENPASSEEQMDMLKELQQFSGEYIKAKNDQHIPKWLASEQRMLRLSCAEEMQNFAATAQKMVNDVANNNDFDTTLRYANTPCDKILKNRILERNMKAAVRGTSLLRDFEQYSKAKMQREAQPNTANVEGPKKNMDSPFKLS